jgi:diacylglycerol O-acyltransferase / wax synthase
MPQRHMSAADVAWLHMDRPDNLMVVNVVLEFDGTLDLGALDQLLRDRLLPRFPRFSQKVVDRPFGRPRFRTDRHFDIRHHLRVVQLPAPAGDAELQRYVSLQMSRALPRDRSPWEMHVIEGRPEGTAVLCRIHHCVADGVALARVLLSLADESDDLPSGSVGIVTRTQRRLGALIGPARHPDQLAASSRQALRRAPALARTLAKELLLSHEARTLFGAPTAVPKQALWTAPIDLAHLRDAAHRHQATVNDVMLASVAGALRRYMVLQDEPPTDLRAMVPFNLRDITAPLPRDLGNRFGLVTVTLPVATPSAPDRIRQVHAAMTQLKFSPEPRVSYGILSAVGLTTPRLERRLVQFFADRATAVITNVPGPGERVSFGGVQIRRVIGWGPRSGAQSLGVAVFSYAGEVIVGFVVDPAVVTHPDLLLHAFEVEVADLLNAQHLEVV